MLIKRLTGNTNIKRLLNSALVFRKHFVVLGLTIFNLWIICEIYDAYKASLNLEKILNAKPASHMHFKLTAEESNKSISEVLNEKDSLMACNQQFTLLKKDNGKAFLAVDYDMYLKNDFVDTVKLLDEFAKKKLIFRISSLAMEQKNNKSQDLDINLKFRAVAYDKIN